MHICVCPPQVALPGHQKKLLISIRKLRERCEPLRWAVATLITVTAVCCTAPYICTCVCV